MKRYLRTVAHTLLCSLAAGWVARAEPPAGASSPAPSDFDERERLLGLFAGDGEDAVPELMEALNADALFLRRTAAHLLARIGEPALPGIEAAFRNEDFQVRRIAIGALANMERLLPYWDRILADPHPSIRAEARRGLLLDRQVSGAAEFLGGRAALRFDGSTSYVQAGAPVLLGGGSFTYELWFRARDPGEAPQGLMGAGRGDNPGRRGVQLLYQAPGRLIFRAANREDRLSLSHDVHAGDRWVHAAAVVDRESGTATLYVNGVPVDQADAVGLGDDDGFDAGPFRLGRRAYTALWFFRGEIAEVRVWRRARSQTEILEAMNRRLNGSEDGLLLYWPMDEGEGETVRDLTAKDNHGQIHAASWAGPSGP